MRLFLVISCETFLRWIVTSKFVVLVSLVTLLFSSVWALADVPITHVDVIDSDGQVSSTHWRTSSTFIWSQDRLLLQTAIEIPSHLIAQLPPELQTHLHDKDADFKAPFPVADDHALLVLELHSPSLMFKLGDSQSLRVTADYRETTWMRNTACRDENVYLSQSEEQTPQPDEAFFLSVACKPARGGVWVQVAASDDVSLSFEPHDQTRFRSVEHGAEFWLPENASRRTLADILVMNGHGDPLSQYALDVQAPATSREPRSSRKLVPVTDAETASLKDRVSESSPLAKSTSLVLGVEGQLVEAHGSLDHQKTARAQTEVSIVGRFDIGLGQDGKLLADLNLPIRRLGAGLDSKGAGTHFGWIDLGYAASSLGSVDLSFGAETSVLDVQSPERTSVVSISPSLTARLRSRYSLTLAPFDLLSHLSVARARADFPVTEDGRNSLTAQLIIGRNWIEPRADSWNMTGFTFGFVGDF